MRAIITVTPEDGGVFALEEVLIMCRIYNCKTKAPFIRLCCRTKHKGLHIPIDKLEYIPEPGTCYRPNKRRSRQATPSPKNNRSIPQGFLPCKNPKCGINTRDEFCDQCKPIIISAYHSGRIEEMIHGKVLSHI